MIRPLTAHVDILQISDLSPYMLSKQGEGTEIACDVDKEHPVMIKLKDLQTTLTSHKMYLRHDGWGNVIKSE